MNNPLISVSSCFVSGSREIEVVVRVANPRIIGERTAGTWTAVRRDTHRRVAREANFILITDRPGNNWGGRRNRLPLQFSRDQRPVGRIEFASFAMLERKNTHRINRRSGPRETQPFWRQELKPREQLGTGLCGNPAR
jgi:hypothetical protein